jgi:hypothetical protein
MSRISIDSCRAGVSAFFFFLGGDLFLLLLPIVLLDLVIVAVGRGGLLA